MTLLEALRDGTPAAWDEFQCIYGPCIRRWSRRVGIAEHDVEEIEQEVFLAVFKMIEGFSRGKDGAFKAWLGTIVRLRVLGAIREKRRGRLRRETRQVLEELADARSDPSRAWAEEHERFVLDQADDYVRRSVESDLVYQAYRGYVVDQHPPRSVAERLGVSVGYVYLAKHRALLLLRERFGDSLD